MIRIPLLGFEPLNLVVAQRIPGQEPGREPAVGVEAGGPRRATVSTARGFAGRPTEVWRMWVGI